MELEEMKQALNEELKAFKENLPTYLTEEDLTSKLTEFEGKLTDLDMSVELKELKDAVEAQGVEMKKFSEGKDLEKSIETLLTDNMDGLKALKNGDGKTVTIKTDVTRASVTDHTLAMRLDDVGQLATQYNVLENLFAQGTVGANSNGVIRYVDQATRTNNADWKAEGTQKPESAITWVEKTLSIQKIADTIPVTMEALDDVNFIASEIRNLLLTNLSIKKDNDLWSGSGSAPIIKGVYTYAGTYTPTSADIQAPTIYDLLVKTQEEIMSGTKYMPNYAVMNIADVNKMKLAKDANNNYILPPFVSTDGTQVSGLTVIVSNSVTANTLLVGDFRYATLYKLGGLKIDIGMIDKQFVENMVTLRAEERMGLLIRSVHEDAFYKVTDIDAALAGLDNGE